MVVAPIPGDPVEDPKKRQPSLTIRLIQWGLLPLLLIVFVGGFALDRLL